MNYYAVIPNFILSSKLLTGDEKVMCGLISGLSEKTGYCYADNSVLAKYIGKSENAAQAIIKRLYNKKIVKNEGSKFDRKLVLSYIKTFDKEENEEEESQEDTKSQIDFLEDNNKDIKSQVDTLKSQIDSSTYIYINKKKIDGQKANDQIKNLDLSFETWWKLWPRKDKKQRALKAFEKLSQKELKILIPATHAHINHKKEVNEYFEHGATFLNGKVFMDYLDSISENHNQNSEPNEGAKILEESKAGVLIQKLKKTLGFYKELEEKEKNRVNQKPYCEYKTNEGADYFDKEELEALEELGADLNGLIEIEFQEGELFRILKGYL